MLKVALALRSKERRVFYKLSVFLALLFGLANAAASDFDRNQCKYNLLVERAQDVSAQQAIEVDFPHSEEWRVNREQPFAHSLATPNLTHPNQKSLRRALRDLAKNRENAAEASEETILSEISATTRDILGSNLVALSPDLVRGWCQHSTNVVQYNFETLNAHLLKPIKLLRHQVAYFTGREFPHSVLVAEFPSERTYWIDLTWAQFDGSSNRSNLVGKKLRESPRGRYLADRLNQDGFVEVTGENADVLVGAFRLAMPKSALSTLNAIAQNETPLIVETEHLRQASQPVEMNHFILDFLFRSRTQKSLGDYFLGL